VIESDDGKTNSGQSKHIAVNNKWTLEDGVDPETPKK
jgi:hypothetical protein